MADEPRRPEAPETPQDLPPGEGADHPEPAAADHWIRLPKLSVPRIEVSDVQLPDIRLPRVVGPAVRPVPDETRRRFDALMSAAAAGALQLSGRLAKAGGRALLLRPRSPVTRFGFAVPVVGLVVIAAGTGAALAYVFDPISGLERRTRVRRQLAMGSQRIGLALGQARRQASSAIAARRPQTREPRAIAEPELMPASQPASRSVVAANTRAMSMVGASSTDATSGNGIG